MYLIMELMSESRDLVFVNFLSINRPLSGLSDLFSSSKLVCGFRFHSIKVRSSPTKVSLHTYELIVWNGLYVS